MSDWEVFLLIQAWLGFWFAIWGLAGLCLGFVLLFLAVIAFVRVLPKLFR